MELSPVQVLLVLSDPRHPALVPTLFFAANAIRSEDHGALSFLLSADLLLRLQIILHALPSLRLPPAAAAHTCAGVAAVLCNVLHVAGCTPTSFDIEALLAAISAPGVLSPLVQWGMAPPDATHPLPPGCEDPLEDPPMCMTSILGGVRGLYGRHSSEYWTPLRLCGYLITEVLKRRGPEGDPRLRDAKVLEPLVHGRVLRHLLEAALEDPGAMPWRVMVAAADCNPAAARKCLGPLLPLLQRVLERYLGGLKAAKQHHKPELATAYAHSMLLATTRFAVHECDSRASRIFLADLLSLLMDFELAALRLMVPPSEEGLWYAAARRPLGDSFQEVMLRAVSGGCRRLRAGAHGWRGGRAHLEEVLLRQGRLLQWLAGMDVLYPTVACRLVDLATCMMDFGDGGAAGARKGGAPAQAGHLRNSMVAASKFLDGLLVEGYPALRWAVKQRDVLELRARAAELVEAAITASGASSQLPRPVVLDGALLLLEDMMYGVVLQKPPVVLLGLCQRAVAEECLTDSNGAILTPDALHYSVLGVRGGWLFVITRLFYTFLAWQRTLWEWADY